MNFNRAFLPYPLTCQISCSYYVYHRLSFKNCSNIFTIYIKTVLKNCARLRCVAKGTTYHVWRLACPVFWQVQICGVLARDNSLRLHRWSSVARNSQQWVASKWRHHVTNGCSAWTSCDARPQICCFRTLFSSGVLGEISGTKSLESETKLQKDGMNRLPKKFPMFWPTIHLLF